ncbi:MAG TPA: hypothetical protein VML54_06915 [Candidatus Limnocylindrales bacterium]|nr:hypothetical protein [Candidatus Limnocylindrales bacterium]
MLKALALLSLPGILAGGFAFGTSTLVGRDPAPTQWVVWGGEAFSNPGELAGWLRARGLTYETWSARHPNAAARLEGREPPQVETAKAAPATEPEAPAAGPSEESVGAGAAGAGLPSPTQGMGVLLVTAALLTLAGSLVALASLPVAFVQRLKLPPLLLEHRPQLAGIGISMAIGLGAAHLF